MKKVLLLLSSIIAVLSADLISFNQLTDMVSQDTNRNIYLDKSLPNYKMDLFIPKKIKQGELYELYKNVLFEHDLQLQFNKRGKFYFVTKLPPEYIKKPWQDPEKKLHYYSYKIKNITNEDVVNVMKIFPSVKFSYLKQSDIIAYSATASEHREVKKLLSRADNKVRSKTVKITIFTLNKEKLISYGSKITKLGYDMALDADNIVTSLISSSNRSFSFADRVSFYFSLYAMQTYGIANIQQSPVLLITNGKKTLVNSVLNVPYLESITTTKDQITTTRDQIRYRDIGLVINVDPKIKGDSVFLDLHLISEELLSAKDDKPITQKITYQNFVTVTKGKPVLLTGIRKVSTTYERDGVPLLSDLPILGELFKNKTRKNTDLSINIMIELVDNKTKFYTKKDFFGKEVKRAVLPVKPVCSEAMALLGFRKGCR